MPDSTDLPEEIGGFLIKRKLGTGGMGSVFLAEDAQRQCDVALKIPAHQDDPALLQRFLREARVASQLSHPNLCRILEMGVWNGQAYFTMPVLEGKLLSECLDRPWSARQAVLLVSKVARAVEVLHQNDIVHRDLKPGNIMLTENDEPIVMDFGLALFLSRDDQPLTRPGHAVGTRGYMAPEQLLRERELLGPQSDVFGLGVVLYQMLTGEFPTVDPAEVFADSARSLTKAPSALGAAVDSTLDTICLQALVANPRRRYQDMGEFAADLEAWLQGNEPRAASKRRRKTARNKPKGNDADENADSGKSLGNWFRSSPEAKWIAVAIGVVVLLSVLMLVVQLIS